VKVDDRSTVAWTIVVALEVGDEVAPGVGRADGELEGDADGASVVFVHVKPSPVYPEAQLHV